MLQFRCKKESLVRANKRQCTLYYITRSQVYHIQLPKMDQGTVQHQPNFPIRPKLIQKIAPIHHKNSGKISKLPRLRYTTQSCTIAEAWGRILEVAQRTCSPKFQHPFPRTQTAPQRLPPIPTRNPGFSLAPSAPAFRPRPKSRRTDPAGANPAITVHEARHVDGSGATESRIRLVYDGKRC